MARNLGLAHSRPRGARHCGHKSEPQNMGKGAGYLAGAESLPIKLWKRGKGTNRLRCQIAFVVLSNEHCIAKGLGAVSKLALEYVIVVNLAQIEKSMELHQPDPSFADSLSGGENPPTSGADLRACIADLSTVWL